MAIRYERLQDGAIPWNCEAHYVSHVVPQRNDRCSVSPDFPLSCFSESSDAENNSVSSPDISRRDTRSLSTREDSRSNSPSFQSFPTTGDASCVVNTHPSLCCRSNSSSSFFPITSGSGGQRIVQSSTLQDKPPMKATFTSTGTPYSEMTIRVPQVTEVSTSGCLFPRSHLHFPRDSGSSNQDAASKLDRENRREFPDACSSTPASENVDAEAQLKQNGGWKRKSGHSEINEVAKKCSCVSDGRSFNVNTTSPFPVEGSVNLTDCNEPSLMLSLQNGGQCEKRRHRLHRSVEFESSTNILSQPSSSPVSLCSRVAKDKFSESDAAEALLGLRNAFSQTTEASGMHQCDYSNLQTDSRPTTGPSRKNMTVFSVQEATDTNVSDGARSKRNESVTDLSSALQPVKQNTDSSGKHCTKEDAKQKKLETSSGAQFHFKKAFCRKFVQSIDKTASKDSDKICVSSKMASSRSAVESTQNGVQPGAAVASTKSIAHESEKIEKKPAKNYDGNESSEVNCEYDCEKTNINLNERNRAVGSTPPLADPVSPSNERDVTERKSITSAAEGSDSTLHSTGDSTLSSKGGSYRDTPVMAETDAITSLMDVVSSDDVTDTDCSGDETSDSDESCSSDDETSSDSAALTKTQKSTRFVLNKPKFTLPAKRACEQKKTNAVNNAMVVSKSFVSAPFPHKPLIPKSVCGKSALNPNQSKLKRVSGDVRIREATFMFRGKTAKNVISHWTGQKSPSIPRPFSSVRLSLKSFNSSDEERFSPNKNVSNSAPSGFSSCQVNGTRGCSFPFISGGTSFQNLRIENEVRSTHERKADDFSLSQEVGLHDDMSMRQSQVAFPTLPAQEAEQSFSSASLRKKTNRAELPYSAEKHCIASSSLNNIVDEKKLQPRRKVAARRSKTAHKASNNRRDEIYLRKITRNVDTKVCQRIALASNRDALLVKRSGNAKTSNMLSSSAVRDEHFHTDTSRVKRTKTRRNIKRHRRKSSTNESSSDAIAKPKKLRDSTVDFIQRSETVCSVVVGRCAHSVQPVNAGFNILSSFPCLASLKAGVARGELLSVGSVAEGSRSISRWCKGRNVSELKLKRQRDCWKQMTIDMFCMGK